jgi:GT2 family glycosyltransferase
MTPRPPGRRAAAMTPRPPVTVIVPFAGSDAALRLCLGRLARVALAPGDEVVVADNRPDDPAAAAAAGVVGSAVGGVRIVRAAGARAPGFARNRAAATATGDWLVFVDADAEPDRDLLAGYFDPPPRDRTGVLAGGIVDVPGGDGLAARASAGRGQLSQRRTLDRAGAPYAQSANMAVRRAAFDAIGGFAPDARAGEDADLCFRLAAAGWSLEERPAAQVRHASRATLVGLLHQLARHGSGAAWLDRRYPGEFPPPRPRELTARLAGAAARAGVAAVRGRRETAGRELVELCGACAFEGGRLLSNRPRGS